jgi:hypothetical protein
LSPSLSAKNPAIGWVFLFSFSQDFCKILIIRDQTKKLGGNKKLIYFEFKITEIEPRPYPITSTRRLI